MCRACYAFGGPSRSAARSGQDRRVASPRSDQLTPAVVRAEVDHGRAELVADTDRPQAWTLLVDGTAQSHVDLTDPTHLEFEYLRRIAHLLDALDPPPPAPLAVLHLRGGAGARVRHLAPARPHSPHPG